MPDSPPLVEQPTDSPTRKVGASTLGAAVAVLLIWIAEANGIAVPAGAEAALTVIVTFLAGYFTRNRAPSIPNP